MIYMCNPNARVMSVLRVKSEYVQLLGPITSNSLVKHKLGKIVNFYSLVVVLQLASDRW